MTTPEPGSPGWSQPDSAPAAPGQPAAGQPFGAQPVGGQPDVGPQQSTEVLGDGVVLPAEPAPKRGRGRRIALIVTAAMVAALSAGVAWAYTALSGGGSQPEEYLPGTAIAFVKVDLDPAAGQKLGAIKFIKKFPQLKDEIDGKSDLRKWLWDRISESDPEAPKWSEVDPWLGDRIGFALLPGSTADKPKYAAAIQVKDGAKAETGLRDGADGKDLGIVIKDGWAIVAETQADAESAAKAADSAPLSENTDFAADLKRIGEDGISAAWFDYKGLLDLSGAEELEEMKAMLPALGDQMAQLDKMHGAAVIRFDGAQLEMVVDVAGADPKMATSAPGHGLATLPGNTVGAMDLGWSKEAVDQAVEQLSTLLDTAAQAQGMSAADLTAGLKEMYGISLPEDFRLLLGEGWTVSVGGPGEAGIPEIGLKIHGDQGAAKLHQLASGLLSDPQLGSLGVKSQQVDGGWLGTSSESWAAALSKPGDLGKQPRYQAVLGDADKAPFSAYVDLAAIGKQYPMVGKDAQEVLTALSSVGITSEVPDPGRVTMTLRLGEK